MSLNISSLQNSTFGQNLTVKANGQLNTARWTVVPIFEVVISVLAVMTNGCTLLTFLHNRYLWTPFNVYLVNLLITNLINALIQNPPDLINELYPTWPYSYAACTLYNYLKYTINGGMCNAHVLITIDRIWAVTSPMSYRNKRSLRTSCIFCLTMWTYIHVFILPGLVADAMYYRMPLDSNICFINTAPQFVWRVVLQFLVYNLPLFIILGAYPIIFWKKRQREANKKAAGIISQNHVGSVKDGSVGRTSKISPTSEELNNTENAIPQAGEPNVTQKSGMRPVGSSSGFRVLTILTIGVLICWTPILTFYTTWIFAPLDYPVTLQVVTFLFSLESVLDPIWFTITIRDLREAQLRMFRCRP